MAGWLHCIAVHFLPAILINCKRLPLCKLSIRNGGIVELYSRELFASHSDTLPEKLSYALYKGGLLASPVVRRQYTIPARSWSPRTDVVQFTLTTPSLHLRWALIVIDKSEIQCILESFRYISVCFVAF